VKRTYATSRQERQTRPLEWALAKKEINKNKNKIKLATVDYQKQGHHTNSERRLDVGEAYSTKHSSVPAEVKLALCVIGRDFHISVFLMLVTCLVCLILLDLNALTVLAPRKGAHVVKPLTCIGEAFGSNSSRDTDCCDWNVSLFSLFLGKCGGSARETQ
jgi:hypothetical protein